MTPSTAVRPSSTTSTRLSIAELVESELIASAYQPLVDLYSDEIVGYEALARGPAGTHLELPAALFAAAHAADMEAEIELECQRAALEGALDVSMAPGQSLFVNFEPRFLAGELPERIAELLRASLEHFSVFVEFTERALTDRPAELLAIAQRLRQMGVGIVLDDVGADPRSLALMPFLAPEVIKLDPSLLQGDVSRQLAEIVHAVNAEAERTGALVLAEGIETEEQRETALALGARYGQGWLFGHPGPLDRTAPAVADAIKRPCCQALSFADTPFGVVSRQRPVQRGDKRLLLELSKQIEAETRNLGYSAVVRGEWDVAVISSHFAVAFVARDLGDSGPDMCRRFDFAVTYDRGLAIEAARAMMARVAAI